MRVRRGRWRRGVKGEMRNGGEEWGEWEWRDGRSVWVASSGYRLLGYGCR